MPQDRYSDPVTGVLYNKLGPGTTAELEAAEREITHAALILLDETPVPPATTCLTRGRSISGSSVTSTSGPGQIRTVAITKGACSACVPGPGARARRRLSSAFRAW